MNLGKGHYKSPFLVHHMVEHALKFSCNYKTLLRIPTFPIKPLNVIRNQLVLIFALLL